MAWHFGAALANVHALNLNSLRRFDCLVSLKASFDFLPPFEFHPGALCGPASVEATGLGAPCRFGPTAVVACSPCEVRLWSVSSRVPATSCESSFLHYGLRIPLIQVVPLAMCLMFNHYTGSLSVAPSAGSHRLPARLSFGVPWGGATHEDCA